MPTRRDDIKLKSGRAVYAHRGIFGLEEGENGLEVTHGCDGYVDWPPANWRDPEPDTDMSADDMREIADMMLERWARFRASLPGSDREGGGDAASK